MTSSIAVQLTANGEKLVQSTGGYLRTITQQAREAARDIAGNTAGAIEAGFSDGMRGVEREYRANIKSLEELTKSASLTNGAVRFDRSAHNAELQAARERLEVQQRLALALDRVASEQGDSAASARIQTAASAASVEKAQEHVRALEQQAILLDRLQVELGQTATAQGGLNTAATNGVERSRAYGSALSNLNFQIQDIFQGIAMGTNPFVILAQQGGQVASVLQDLLSAAQPVGPAIATTAGSMTGLNTAASSAKASTLQLAAADVAAVPATNALSNAARIETGTMAGLTVSVTGATAATAQFTIGQRLATFAAGPMGAAAIALISVVGMLAYKMGAGAEASDGLKTKLDIQTASYETLMKAVRDYNDAQRDSAAVTKLVTEEAHKQALATIKLAQAKLAAAEATAFGNAGQGTGGAAGAFTGGQVDLRRAELRELQEQLRTTEKALANQYVDGRLNKEKEITNRVGVELLTLEDRYDKGAISVKKYREEKERLLKVQEKELDAYRESKRETSGSGAGAAARDARVGDMVTLVKQLFPGAKITSTTGGKHTKGSDHYAGRAIDFVPGGGMGRYSTAEVEQILKDAGVDIRRNAKGTQQLFGPGRSATKPGDHDDHFHVAWKGAPDPERAAEAQQRVAERAAQAAEQLARNIDNAGERAAALRSQFDPLPADIDRASNALIDIQQEIAKNQALLKEKGLGADQVKALQAAIADLELTRDTLVPASLSKPIRDDLAAMQEAIEGQQMLIDGRRAEYDRLQDNVDLARLLGAESTAQLGTMIRQRGVTDAQLKAYYDQRDALRAHTIEMQRQQEEQQKLLQVVDDVASSAKSAIYDLFDGKGLGAAKNFFKSLFDIQKQIMTEEIFTAVFGDAFEKQKLKILGLDKVDETGRAMAVAIERTIDPILALGDAAQAAANQLGNVAANDNGLAGIEALGKASGGTDIVVTAQRTMQQEMRDSIKLLGDKVLGPKLAGSLGKAVETGLRGAAYGEAASGVLRSLGVKQSKMGGQLGGAAGYALGSLIPGMGPLGGLIGGALGGTLGGLLKKTPRGYATIGAGGIVGTGGNSKAAREAGTGAAGATMDSLESIAKALGGTFDPSRGSVSIGRSGDSWHVDTSGKGRLKKSQGGLDFNDDYEAAVRAATLDLIKDGVITGISAASQRILQSGKDLQQSIEKASLIESLPKLLKARTNPVAAALDELNDKWDRTVAVLKEGGATAAQYAEAQKLYELERADIMKAANDNLKSFIDSMNFGPSSGLSLRDQSANARKELQPYLDAIAKGDVAGVDRDKYLAAADSYMQISRALNGSGTGYFNTVDELRKATQSLLDQSVNQAKTAEARDPFAEQTAKSTQATANLLDDQNKLLVEQNKWLQQIAQSAGGGGSDFIGAGRLFVGNEIR